MFKGISQIPEFEKIFDDDVPNAVKKILEEYACPKDHADEHQKTLKTNFCCAPLSVLKSGSILSAFKNLARHIRPDSKAHADATNDPSLAPLPRSPHFHHMLKAICEKLEPFEEVMEGDGKPMERVSLKEAKEFVNWAKTVRNRPSHTFVARTKVGLCNLVKWARKNGKKVRVAGYRHTVSDLPVVCSSIVLIISNFCPR